MSNEHLHNPETTPTSTVSNSEPEFLLTAENIALLCSARQSQLEQLQKKITPKFFTNIREKLLTEQTQFTRLLTKSDERQQTRAQYSFVLNPYFFEQKFFEKIWTQ